MKRFKYFRFSLTQDKKYFTVEVGVFISLSGNPNSTGCIKKLGQKTATREKLFQI